MNNSINYELIDQYLLGHLKGDQLQHFEALMTSDPVFKNEVDFQKNIVESIENQRKMELKSRLSNVVVSSGLSNIQKVALTAASILAVFVGGVTAYQVYSSEETVVPIVSPSLSTSVVPESEGVVDAVIPIENTIAENRNEVVTTEESVTAVADNALLPSERSSEVTVETSPQQITPNSLFENAMGLDEDKLEEDDAGGVSPLIKIADNATFKKANHIKPKTERGNRLKYRYNGSELVLIGDKFEEHSETFTLLMDQQSKGLYLLFEDDYYEIENHHNDHTYRLIPLESAEDINKLKKAE